MGATRKIKHRGLQRCSSVRLQMHTAPRFSMAFAHNSKSLAKNTHNRGLMVVSTICEDLGFKVQLPAFDDDAANFEIKRSGDRWWRMKVAVAHPGCRQLTNGEWAFYAK